MALVLDTSVLYASLDTRDPSYQRCVELLSGLTEPPVVPTPVLVELDQLLAGRGAPKGWTHFTAAIRDGAYQLFAATPALTYQAAKVQARYSDMPIGFVDAFVFVTCEVLGERKVATLDHRHFSVLRTKGRKPLQLVPG